jgi:lipopolysaccharide biosynthesis protein
MSETSQVRAICFHLPQYHPIRENDEWWGKGFTEWANVTRTRPRFKDHYQPHLPADLGFYDLRLPEARQAQADLARQHGIHGFCYYHYWFNGRRLLERPFNEILASGQPRFPFCLCWANENWTRRWDGQERDILLEQNYGDEDDLNHIRWLANAFRDPRYIRIQGKPIFLVYRLSRLPNPARTVKIWRNEAGALGVGDIL